MNKLDIIIEYLTKIVLQQWPEWKNYLKFYGLNSSYEQVRYGFLTNTDGKNVLKLDVSMSNFLWHNSSSLDLINIDLNFNKIYLYDLEIYDYKNKPVKSEILEMSYFFSGTKPLDKENNFLNINNLTEEDLNVDSDKILEILDQYIHYIYKKFCIIKEEFSLLEIQYQKYYKKIIEISEEYKKLANITKDKILINLETV